MTSASTGVVGSGFALGGDAMVNNCFTSGNRVGSEMRVLTDLNYSSYRRITRWDGAGGVRMI